MYERGDFGIEYSTSQRRRRRGEPGVFTVAAIVAAAAAAVAVFAAARGCSERPRNRNPPPARPARPDPVSPRGANEQSESGILARRGAAAQSAAAGARDEPPATPEMSSGPSAALAQSMENGALARLEADGSPRTRVLVRRLAKLNESRDLVAAISTIEELRSLPDARMAADDFLARRLGELNMELLMSGRENKWTAEVSIGQGYTLQRLAWEHGTTVAALMRLNGISDPRKIRAGRRLTVLEHPKFRLEADSRSRVADLYINRRFFKRYALLDAPAAGEREVSRGESASSALKNLGISVRPEDREELLMFLSPGSVVHVE